MQKSIDIGIIAASYSLSGHVHAKITISASLALHLSKIHGTLLPELIHAILSGKRNRGQIPHLVPLARYEQGVLRAQSYNPEYLQFRSLPLLHA
jgi:hypothetical protein